MEKLIQASRLCWGMWVVGEGKMRHNFELISREKRGGRNRERIRHQVFTIKPKRRE